MLKFFRRIRKKLFFENKTSKYLLYAVGEISLIIIGILIALTVSEWNNNKKDRAYESEMLTLIKTDLEDELQYLINDEIPYMNIRRARVSKLDSLLKEAAPTYDKSLDSLFGAVWGIVSYSFEIAQYENLKSTGLNLISESALREQLIRVYEETHPMLDRQNELDNMANIEIYLPYHMPNFHSFRWGIYATPIDYEKTWADTYYHNVVFHRLNMLNNRNRAYEIAVTEMSALVEMIDKYLE